LLASKIIKLFINLICELIIPVSCKELCFKTDEYAARNCMSMRCRKFTNYNWASRSIAICARPHWVSL